MTTASVAAGNLISDALGKVVEVIKKAVIQGVTYNAKLEQYKVALTTLLGSAEDAEKVMNKIQEDAKATPFDVDGLTQANRLLISTGLSAEDSRNVILALGDAISATGGGNEELSRMAVNLQQIKNAGKATALDIKQFAYSGIDIYGLLADYTGKTREEVSNMTIDYETLSNALIHASQEGGKYYNAMESQSKTLNGQISNMEDSLNTLLGNAFKPISDILTKGILPVMNYFLESGPIAETIIVSLSAAIGVLAGALAIQATVNLVTKAFKALNLTLAANPILLIVSLIAGLVVAFIYLWNNSESFRNFWKGLWDSIKKAVSTAVNFIVQWFNKIVDFVKNNWQGILLFIANPFVGGFKLLYDNCEVFRNFINNFIESIKNFFVNGWNNIVSFFTETIPQWIQNVINWFSQLPYMIGYHIGQILGNIIQFGINLWNWITVDLPQIIQSIIDWFASLPSKIQEWLNNTINNIKDWGVNVYNVTSNWMSRTIETVVNWFRQLPGRIWTWLMDVISKVKSWGTDLVNKAKEAAQNMFNTIVDTIQGLPDRMMNVGKNIVEGLWNGIKNAKDWMKQKVGEFANGVLDGMKDSLGIHSPSTKARDLVGKFIPEGVAVGVEANTDSALKAIDNMNDDIMSEMNKAVAFETGSVNAKASVKSNNSMLNVIQAAFNIDGSIDIDGQRAGRILTPYMSKTLKTGGVY